MSICECRGQTRAIEQLQRARRSGRLAHGYIFHGPEGIGKKLLASQWAQLLLCSNPVERSYPSEPGGNSEEILIDDSCGQCAECHLCESGNHPDFHMIHKNLVRFARQGRDRQPISLPIDVIREFLIEPAGTHPQHGRARVFIVDPADQMTTAAQNALLKTLEEPPPSTFILLVTSQYERLPATLRSRCQGIRFGGLRYEFVYEQLITRGVSPQEAGYWSDFSQGQLGVALSFCEYELYPIKQSLTEKVSSLDSSMALSLAGWAVDQAGVFSKRYQENHPDDSASGATRQGCRFMLQLISHIFSTALRQFHGMSPEFREGYDQPDLLFKIGRRFGDYGCSQAIRACDRAESFLSSNVNPTLIFESLMLQYLDYVN